MWRTKPAGYFAAISRHGSVREMLGNVEQRVNGGHVTGERWGVGSTDCNWLTDASEGSNASRSTQLKN